MVNGSEASLMNKHTADSLSSVNENDFHIWVIFTSPVQTPLEMARLACDVRNIWL